MSGESAPKLSPKKLIEWATAELNVFRWGVRRYIGELLVKSRGLPFGQGQHDCVTLKSTDSYLAAGMQFVDADSKQNVVLCLGFEKVTAKSAVAMAQTLDGLCQRLIGRKYTDIAYATIADHAALKVATEFGHDTWGCDMHDISKIAESAVGDLTRSRRHVVQNPFQECVDLLGKVHKIAKCFRNSRRRAELHALRANVPGGFAAIRPELKLNGTRIAARLREIFSVLRLWKGLRAYVCALARLRRS